MQFPISLKNTAASVFAVTLCLTLLGCGGGGGGDSNTVGNAGCQNLGSTAFSSTAISGKVTFDRVPVAVNGATPQLNYAGTVQQPARSIVVEAIDCNSGQVQASATTNATGDYALAVPGNRSVFIRALARMNTIGANSAPFLVIDNTEQGAQWATDGAVFGSGTVAALTQNLHAGSGWTGTTYDDKKRIAGPFAILDTIYQAAQKIIASDAQAAFPALELNWSPNNIAFDGDRALGQIGNSIFTSVTVNGVLTRQIYVLGFADNDTDEYDQHVVAHEFGHYLQSAFSRDDSIGGSHSQNDRLDMRVAFSEGWGNAWSGIALNNPVYSDTNGTSQVGGLTFNVSQGASNGAAGWFKESSVQQVFWDFTNSQAIGFTPVWNALKNGLTRSAALAGIHSYARALASDNPVAVPAITAILATQNIHLPSTAYGDGESNFGSPEIPGIKPIYLPYGAVNSTLAGVCIDNLADPQGVGNKAGQFRYVRVNLPESGLRTFTVRTESASASSDPDFVLYDRTGRIFQGDGVARNSETASTTLSAGEYVLAINDFNLSSSCFSLTVN